MPQPAYPYKAAIHQQTISSLPDIINSVEMPNTIVIWNQIPPSSMGFPDTHERECSLNPKMGSTTNT